MSLQVTYIAPGAKRPRTHEDRQDLAQAVTFLARANRRFQRDSAARDAVRTSQYEVSNLYHAQELSWDAVSDAIKGVTTALAKNKDERVINDVAVAFAYLLKVFQRVGDDLAKPLA